MLANGFVSAEKWSGALKNLQKMHSTEKNQWGPILVFLLPLQVQKIGLGHDSNPPTPASQAPSPDLKIRVNNLAKAGPFLLFIIFI